MDDVASVQLIGIAVQIQDGQVGESGMQRQYGMRAVVAACDGDALRGEESVDGV